MVENRSQSLSDIAECVQKQSNENTSDLLEPGSDSEENVDGSVTVTEVDSMYQSELLS